MSLEMQTLDRSSRVAGDLANAHGPMIHSTELSDIRVSEALEGWKLDHLLEPTQSKVANGH